MSSNMINTLAAKRHLKNNWEFFVNYCGFKRLEPQMFRINEDCLKDINMLEIMTNKYVNRTSHETYVPGSRYLYREEQIWEAMFVMNSLLNKNTMKPGDVVADIGTENSFLPLYLTSINPVVVWGLDIFDRSYGEWFNKTFLENTKAGMFILNSNLDGGTIIYTQTDATNMYKFHSEFFNIITCISTIEHILNDTKAMQEMAGALKPDGKILLTFPIDEEYSQARDAPDEESWDLDRVYSPEALYKRLIDPSGLKVYDKFHYDFNDKGKYKFTYNGKKVYRVGSLILNKPN